MDPKVLQYLSLVLFCCSICCHYVSDAMPPVIRIGGLFDIGDVKQEAAFRYSVERVNLARTSIHGSRARWRLHPVMERIPPFDSFKASKRVCVLLRGGVAAIFGPQSGQTSAHVQSICDAMEIPHIETRWDYRLRRDDYSINLYPHPSSLSQAYLDLVHQFQWKSVCILYEDKEGLVRLQEILKTPSPPSFKKTIKQLPRDGDYRPVLRMAKSEGENNIILDCATDKVKEVLKQAQQIGMMTPYNNYIITSLDLHLVDFEDFKYGGSNITAVRLIDPEKKQIKNIMNGIKDSTARLTDSKTQREIALGKFWSTETALMYDAVHLFVLALEALDNSTQIQIGSLQCDGENAWDHGLSLINYVKIVNMSGMTGVVEFDALGFRTHFNLDIIELSKDGFMKVGTWSKRQGTNYTRTYKDFHNKTIEGLRNRTLIVSFADNDPYIMLKKSPEALSGNDRYEGFCVDLLSEIAKQLHFKYTLVIVPDDAYGTKNKLTNEWNGMIKELLDNKADLAITDLTISHEREEAVDFTMPFMNMGVAIIYKKPRKMAPSLFSFLSPLSLEVWIYMMGAYLGVSILMYILARFSPYEWQNPHPCNPEPDTLENQFTILNCLWFAIGSLMQQGCDFLPQAMSTRMVAGMWWFFTLIMISSYTANLAAFLTVERMESPIESVEDLAAQTKIKYGCLGTGTTYSFFRDSSVPTYSRMFQFMKKVRPSVFAASNEEGYQRVQDSDGLYAYLSESSSIEYVVERNCNLTQVGGLLDSKSYGIALPPGSPYKGLFDEAILSMQERGRQYVLKEKWWRQERGGGKCKEEASGSGMANELNLSNVGGVFVVLLGGMGLALVVAIYEFLMECRGISKDDEIPFIGVLMKELKFVLKCKGSVKPVKKKPEQVEEEDEEDDDDDDDDGETNDIYSSNVYNNFGLKNPPT